MFSNFGEIIALVVCMAGILIGAALALAAGNNGNPVPAVIGIIICIISLIEICFLEEPFTDENMYQKMSQNVKNVIISVEVQ